MDMVAMGTARDAYLTANLSISVSLKNKQKLQISSKSWTGTEVFSWPLWSGQYEPANKPSIIINQHNLSANMTDSCIKKVFKKN